jgi:hypothetical protein
MLKLINQLSYLVVAFSQNSLSLAILVSNAVPQLAVCFFFRRLLSLKNLWNNYQGIYPTIIIVVACLQGAHKETGVSFKDVSEFRAARRRSIGTLSITLENTREPIRPITTPPIIPVAFRQPNGSWGGSEERIEHKHPILVESACQAV